MPNEDNEANQCILGVCRNGIKIQFVRICLIDLDRATIEDFIRKEKIPFPYKTVRPKIVNERTKAEKLRKMRLKKISVE